METMTAPKHHSMLEMTFELSNQSIYWINEEGEIVFVNQAACKSLEYTKEELLTLHVWDLNPVVNTKEKFKSIFDDYIQSENEISSNVFESLHRTKSGRIFPIEISSRTVFLDEQQYLISYVKDITSRVEKNERIQLYFEVINSSKDIILLVDHRTQNVEFANKTAIERLGYSLTEFQKMKVSDFRRPLTKHLVETSEVFEAIEDKRFMTTMGVYVCKDGHTFPVETSVSLQEYTDKDYIVAISRDISERLELEKKREDVNNKLKNYNKTLEKDVEKAKAELLSFEKLMYHQSKMAAMGEMLENIAHQWRQPLSIISVLATGMKIQSENDALDKRSLESGLEEMNKNSQYLSRTIDDFGDFFKPNKNKSSFSLIDVIDNALNLSVSNVKSLDICIHKKIEDIVLFNYQNELIQVLINIINNAKDVLITVENIRLIFLTAQVYEDTVLIEIKDSGGGIEPNIIEKLFEPYFSTKHKSQGTGIGLYMSEEIITKHMGGEICVENCTFEFEGHRYKGAKFMITLPMV